MKHLYVVFTLCIAFALMSGCSNSDHPVSVESPAGAVSHALPVDVQSNVLTQSNTINNYLVNFDGRVFANNQTTFTYTVSGTGVSESMTHFTVELPDCAPLLDAYYPTESVSVNYDPNSGLDGIDWHITVDPDGSQTYSITFPGDIPLGVVRAAVRTPSTVLVGEIAGPCAGFEVAGTVFVDSDSNGLRGADEPGIVNVTVELVDADNNVQSTVTDIDGHYSYTKIAGTYTVRIPEATAAEDFNEELYESFTATTPTSASVTVGPDATGINFGYETNADKVLTDFDTGQLTTTGENVKFWKKQFRGTGQIVESQEALLGYLETIEGLFLPVPYQFTDGNEIAEATEILSINPRDDVALLRQELLAAELNFVSGRTMNDAELQSVLLSWAESVLFDASSTAGVRQPADFEAARLISSGSLGDAVDITTQMNSGGTGGGSGTGE